MFKDTKKRSVYEHLFFFNAVWVEYFAKIVYNKRVYARSDSMVENICAPATPYGSAAISIIRCSGPEAIELVNKIFKGSNLLKAQSHTIHHGYIMDEQTVIDEVLCNVFIAPHSYDGENTVEINCHGGVLVTSKVLQLLLTNGFRLAERGEFSKRAFLNKRLDFTQAEAIMDIIGAKNDIALKASEGSLRKTTSNLIRDFREKLLDILAKIAVNIDYPEYEDSLVVTNEYLSNVLTEMLKNMEEIIANSKISTLAIQGVKTAIVGKPNVGKSSILNYLLNEDKAIVSNIPGTTRDLVEGSLNVGNITLHLIDTAGIRESEDAVEKIGIERSNKILAEADLVLLVLDASTALEKADLELLEITKNKKRIILANKVDLLPKWHLADVIEFSTVNKTGFNELCQKLDEVTCINQLNVAEGKFLANERQLNLMQKAYQSLKQALSASQMGLDIDLVEIDIKAAFDSLGIITGEATPDELLTALFTKFCLGK